MHTILALLFFLALSLSPSPGTALQHYGVATIPTPVLNTPYISAVFGGKHGTTLKTDHCGMVRELEFVALPGTSFTILTTFMTGTETIYEVTTEDYQTSPGVHLYLDSRFIQLRETIPPPRTRTLPTREQIIASLQSSIGNSYVWGGNISQGIPQLAEWFYRGASSVSERMVLTGVDCSGLLYQATRGWTPRNTSQLVGSGTGLKIKGKSASAIVKLLQPLDLIVWDGHVVIVMDSDTAIESRLECGTASSGGVTTTPLKQRIQSIMRSRKPEDIWNTSVSGKGGFVIRRWYGDH